MKTKLNFCMKACSVLFKSKIRFFFFIKVSPPYIDNLNITLEIHVKFTLSNTCAFKPSLTYLEYSFEMQILLTNEQSLLIFLGFI